MFTLIIGLIFIVLGMAFIIKGISDLVFKEDSRNTFQIPGGLIAFVIGFVFLMISLTRLGY